MIPCPACGSENAPSAKFCSECGAPLAVVARPAREERKVVTVLFCDLVGFTSRAEQLDPEDVRAMLSPYFARLRTELEQLGGTVEKFIGDAVMAVFGAPVAHEDDPERAVRAALRIRDALVDEDADLQVRIGITTGEALVALGARPSEGEGMVSGDVVNTAARLQAAAPVNGILVDETTHRATESMIDYEELAAVEAKGKTEPVRAWRAREARARLGAEVRPAVRTALVGRTRELQALREAFAWSREDRVPQLVTLVGVPGIGKSRLVYELFARDVESVPELIYWRQGRSLPYGEGVSFWALAEMVRAHAGILESEAAGAAATKLRRAVAEAFADPAEASWVESHLRPLVGIEGDGESTEDRRTEAFAAWRRLFEALAERSALVLVFEDLQWADEGLLDFVDYLVDWAVAVPLFVLCTARPELLARRPAWGGGKANAAMISLSPLSDEETAHLLAALLERPVLLAGTQQALLARAGGNPLYAEQYARLQAEHGDGGDLQVPESVQGIIAARLDGLPAEEKELLQNAAVVGKAFWTGALATIRDESPGALEQRLHLLERKQFVRRERRGSVAGESEYVFQHVLLRDVAYGQIPRARRAEKHRRAAEWIESLAPDRAEERTEMLAHHYESALQYASAAGQDTAALAERTRRALREAGDHAYALNAFAAAARFYRAALELWPAGDAERPHLLFSYGRVLAVVGSGAQEVLAQAGESLLELGDRERAAEAEILLAEVVQDQGRGRQDTLQAHLRRAAMLVEDAPATPAKAYVLSSISRFAMVARENEEAIRVGREALAMAERLGLDLMQAHALNNVGTARAQSGDLAGLQDLERSIEITESLNSPESVRGLDNLASSLATLGRLRRAWELRAEARRLADRFGHAPHVRWLHGELVGELYSHGRWDDALELADRFVAQSETGTGHYLESTVRCFRGRIARARGESETVLQDAAKALAVAEDTRDPQALIPALAFSAFSFITLGRNDEAGPLVERALGVGDFSAAEESSLELIWALVALGRGVTPLADGPSAWQEVAGAIVAGEFARAADLCVEIGVLPDEAYARLRAAEALVADGRRAEADAQLQQALAFWSSVGATRYIREGEALLAASA